MKAIRVSLLLGVVSLFCGLCLQTQQQAVSQTLSAQAPTSVVPPLVRFSGVLKDETNRPLSGTVGIAGVTFAIYKDQYEGAPLWLETQNVQADAKGKYTVQLGATKPEGLPLDLFSSGEARWLGVRVNGGEEQPRVVLVSVPYALKALDAETLGGRPASAFMVVPPSGTKGSQLGPLAEQANEIICLSGTACKTGFVPLFSSNGGSAKVNDSIITQSGATVGIAGSVSANGNVNVTGLIGLPNTSNATTGVITLGGSPFAHNFGTSNTFVGHGAGNFSLSGDSNTATGVNSLVLNTTGNSNTVSGLNALFHNTTGSRNTASGVSALVLNTTGNENTASGEGTLFHNTTGFDNTATGFNALFSNTTGSYNTASGVSALHNNTGVNGIVGSASYNVASGYQALYSNTTGGYNAASGYQSLYSNTEGNLNTASGPSALQLNTTGSSNTAIGYSALSNNTIGGGNTGVGWDANVSPGSNLSNATAIGFNAHVDASNKIRLGNGQVTVIEGQVAYTFTSDKNQKENFQPVEGEQVLRKIDGLTLTSWNYIGHDPKQFRHYGPVAQEFFGAFGHDVIGTIGTSTTINSGDMEGILMVAVQALEKRTVELAQEKERLTETVKALKAELEAQREGLAAIAGRLKRLDRQELAQSARVGR